MPINFDGARQAFETAFNTVKQTLTDVGQRMADAGQRVAEFFGRKVEVQRPEGPRVSQTLAQNSRPQAQPLSATQGQIEVAQQPRVIAAAQGAQPAAALVSPGPTAEVNRVAIVPSLDQVKAREFLGGLADLRLYVPHSRQTEAEKGWGPLSASVEAYNNLLSLGFQGELEIVYRPDGALTAGDLAKVFPNFPAGGQVTGPNGQAVRIKYTPLGPDLPKCDIAVTGELDHFFDPKGEDAQALRGADPAANVAKSRYLLAFQPAGWHFPRVMLDFDRRHGEQLHLAQDSAIFASAIRPGSPVARPPHGTPEAIERFVADTEGTLRTSGRPTDERLRGSITAVLELVAAGNTELMPSYGMHNAAPGSLESIALAAKDVSARIGKPVILFDILNNQPLTGLGDSSDFIVLDATAANTAQRLAQLQPGQVAILRQPGGLPKAYFDQVVLNATLPVVLEGAGTVTTCIANGLPYIGLRNNPSITDLPGNGGAQALRGIADALESGQARTPAQRERLTNAILDARTGGSTLNSYYAGLRSRAMNPANDQMAVGFATLARRVEREATTTTGRPAAAVDGPARAQSQTASQSPAHTSLRQDIFVANLSQDQEFARVLGRVFSDSRLTEDEKNSLLAEMEDKRQSDGLAHGVAATQPASAPVTSQLSKFQGQMEAAARTLENQMSVEDLESLQDSMMQRFFSLNDANQAAAAPVYERLTARIGTAIAGHAALSVAPPSIPPAGAWPVIPPDGATRENVRSLLLASIEKISNGDLPGSDIQNANRLIEPFAYQLDEASGWDAEMQGLFDEYQRLVTQSSEPDGVMS